MGFFDRKQDSLKELSIARASGAFKDRASIFNYLFFEKGVPFEEAEEQATKMARIMVVPDKIEPPKEGIEKYVGYAKQISVVAEENPKVWDGFLALLALAAPFFSSIFTAQTINKENSENNRDNDIDFNQQPKDLD